MFKAKGATIPSTMGDDDLLGSFAEELASFLVEETFAALDVRPLAMTHHGSGNSVLEKPRTRGPCCYEGRFVRKGRNNRVRELRDGNVVESGTGVNSLFRNEQTPLAPQYRASDAAHFYVARISGENISPSRVRGLKSFHG